ncbi:2-hydroxyacyl-CoA dehydratase [Tissierella sp. Yu-01]|uniref:2-hydroxyacyl-CoA dehydratase n=1 Tax=Tissierella sp. Yu-01 TaxID=3035694 RepID=UPI00240D3EF7|nr:2-hydroxyacyl-CoA dehydratase [Tissierella sp. Yu-01]WFA08762.1 2-hydroxyacyl-CoA dehydratase [Tissierella sp. Yu-01]
MHNGSGKVVEFTKEMRDDYTILVPNMLPIHFSMLKCVFRSHGYNMVVLENEGPSVVEEGLRLVHNDTCYPALLVIGQLIDALKSGKYNVNKAALMITQTGGGCRASNYIHLLRKALDKSGYEQVPVISLNASGLERNSGFKFTIPMLRKAIAVVAYGDLLMLLNNQVKPYEINKGESQELVNKWIKKMSDELSANKGYKLGELKDNLSKITKSFSEIPKLKVSKVKVGVVGEIYVKYSSLGNNKLEEFLHNEDCEVMVPGLMGFLMYCVENGVIDTALYGGNFIKGKISEKINEYLGKIEGAVNSAVSKYECFVAPTGFKHLKHLGEKVIGLGSKMGEGWLLPAEIMELIQLGYENIICTQPFGCLPNHIIGKGLIRKIKGIHDDSNIVPIDYDPSATKVNQENRIKLMLSVAKEKLQTEILLQEHLKFTEVLSENKLSPMEQTN